MIIYYIMVCKFFPVFFIFYFHIFFYKSIARILYCRDTMIATRILQQHTLQNLAIEGITQSKLLEYHEFCIDAINKPRSNFYPYNDRSFRCLCLHNTFRFSHFHRFHTRQNDNLLLWNLWNDRKSGLFSHFLSHN